MRPRTSYLALLALTAVFAAHLAVNLPGLPDRLATHFAGGGAANGWMTRDGFVFFSAAMWGVMVGSFWSARWLLNHVDPGWVNLPNKEVLLAPERRAGTIDFVGGAVERMGLLTLLGMIGVNHLVFEANRLPEPRLSEGPFLLGLAGYFVVLAVWLVWFLVALRRRA